MYKKKIKYRTRKNVNYKLLIVNIKKIMLMVLIFLMTRQANGQTVTLNCDGVDYCFDIDESFIGEATAINGAIDNSTNGDGCGLDIVEGYSPNTCIANFGSSVPGNQGFRATFGNSGLNGLVNLPGVDFVMFEYQFSVDPFDIIFYNDAGFAYGPFNFIAGSDCGVMLASYSGGNANQSGCILDAQNATLAAAAIDLSNLGIPDNEKIFFFDILTPSGGEPDFAMAGITCNSLLIDICVAPKAFIR